MEDTQVIRRRQVLKTIKHSERIIENNLKEGGGGHVWERRECKQATKSRLGC